jgi:hypothetical protein
MDLVKSDDRRDWPVMHIPFYANTFILAYGYYLALKKRLSELVLAPTAEQKLETMNKKIHLEEWTKDMPAIDTKAGYNIVFANKMQRNAWKQKEAFYFAPIFSYEQEFVLIEKKALSSFPGSPSVENIYDLCKLLFDPDVSAKLDEIRIVSDIEPEAWSLRTELVKEFSKKVPPKRAIGHITIVNAKARSLWDVIELSPRTFKIYLFGSPLCEILAAEKMRYKTIEYKTKSAAVDTYLGIWSANPDSTHLPFSSVLEFFYSNDNLPDVLRNNILLDTAGKFLKYAESSFPAVDERKFATAFLKSVKHSKLVKRGDFIIECD